MNTIKKRLLGVLALGLCLICAPSHAARPIYAKLNMPILFESQIPRDIDQVSAALSKMTEEKIGVSV
ncbi:MAG: hypothetical protein RSD95_15145, partial [Clostridia bacterium]